MLRIFKKIYLQFACCQELNFKKSISNGIIIFLKSIIKNMVGLHFNVTCTHTYTHTLNLLKYNMCAYTDCVYACVK